MRRFLVALLVLVSICPSVLAQDWVGVNRDDHGNIIRGSYLTNGWYDNWYIAAAGGITTAFSSINDPVITPQFDFSILKWFTPSIGARLGYQGFSGKEKLTVTYNPYQINHSPLPFEGTYGQTGTLSYGLAYVHGDLLWNLSNAFWGYKRDRFLNVSLYANTGYCRLYDNTKGQGITSANCDNEWALGVGLYNTFRLSDRFVALLDLRHFSTSSHYKTIDGIVTNHLTATVGIAYNIYRTYWNRASAIMSESSANKANAEAAMKALESAKAEREALIKKVAEKEAEIEAKEKELLEANKNASNNAPQQNLDNSKEVIEVPYNSLVARAEAADLIIYFYQNEDKCNFSELRHLDDYIQSTLNADPDHVFYLTGSADKGTGTMERNTFLCRSRAYGVRDILVSDYSVKPENVIIKATVVSDKHIDGALDRCVIIESK